MPAAAAMSRSRGFWRTPVRASLFLAPAMFGPLAGSPTEFTGYIRADVRKWERVIRDANIKVE